MLTPTIPKAGFAGYCLEHCGHEMSLPPTTGGGLEGGAVVVVVVVVEVVVVVVDVVVVEVEVVVVEVVGGGRRFANAGEAGSTVANAATKPIASRRQAFTTSRCVVRSGAIACSSRAQWPTTLRAAGPHDDASPW